MTLQEYYITLDAITNYTAYNSDEIALVFGDVDKSLKVISHSVNRLINTYRKGAGLSDHIKYMRKKIYDNANGEVTALMLAMIEAVKGAIESGMDLNAYINEPKETLPKTVYQELRMAELLDSSKKPTDTLAIAYTQDEYDATEVN